MDKKYISYFQKVVTIGVMTYAKNVKEAEKKAWVKFKDSEGLTYCLYEESKFELSDTDEWCPEIETSYTEDGVGWKFNPSAKTKDAIAKKIGKNIDDLTEEDFASFIKDSVEKAVK